MILSKTNREFKINHFSLLELLASMAIIAILISVSFGVYSSIKDSAAESQTDATLKQTVILLKKLEMKVGYFPQSSGLTGSPNIFSKNILWLGVSDLDGKNFQYTFSTTYFNSTSNEPVKTDSSGNITNVNYQLAVELNKMSDMASFKNTFCKYVTKDNKRYYYLVDGWGRPVYFDTSGDNGLPLRLISTGSDGSVGSTDVPVFDVSSGSVVLSSKFTTLSNDEQKSLGTTGDDLLAE